MERGKRLKGGNSPVPAHSSPTFSFFFFRAHSVVLSVTATEKEVDKLRPPYLSSYSGLLFISLSVFTGTLLKKENMTVT